MDTLGYHKFCARWVTKQLADLHKTQRMGSALTFLQRYWEEGDEFLDRIMTDCKGILLTEFMAPGTKITSQVYCEMLHKLKRSMQNKQQGTLSKGVVLLHDNARPHTAVCTNAFIKLFGWEIFDHPPYSPDLSPSDYHLFSKMKVWLATQRFHTNEELMDGVNNWLHNLAAPFFDEGLQKLVPRHDKCLNLDGNYVEK